jgi:hypothetical protein
LAVGAIAVLSILAVGTTSSVMQELRLAKFIKEDSIAPIQARSVVSVMKIIWINDATPQAITLYDLRPRSIALAGDTAQVTLSDEESKINIDRAPREVIARLPVLSGQNALIDALFAAALAHKEEMLLIKDMTEELYEQLKENVTTYGVGVVNINTAGPETLAALGMDDGVVSKIRAVRSGDDGQEGTEDDVAFSFPGEIVFLLEAQGLNPDQKIFLEGLVASGSLGVNSDNIAFDITMKKSGVPEGKAQNKGRSFHIVFNRVVGMVVRWQEL